MKKIFFIFLTIFLLVNPVVFAKISQEELDAGVKKCNEEKTSECYRLLLVKSQNNIIRYIYGMFLYEEKKFVEARRELTNFLYYDKNENPKLDAFAQQCISDIDNRYKSQVQASAYDQGHYLNEISKVAKWENPDNIKVYIMPSGGKEVLFRRAFQIWDNRLIKIHFSFQTNPDNADIICSYVDFIKKGVAGVTEFPKGFLQRVTTDELYFNPPVTISIAKVDSNLNRPYTDNELQSIILHEIGHAIGILEHTKNKNDIMFYSTESYKNGNISNRDVNTIKELYK